MRHSPVCDHCELAKCPNAQTTAPSNGLTTVGSPVSPLHRGQMRHSLVCDHCELAKCPNAQTTAPSNSLTTVDSPVSTPQRQLSSKIADKSVMRPFHSCGLAKLSVPHRKVMRFPPHPVKRRQFSSIVVQHTNAHLVYICWIFDGLSKISYKLCSDPLHEPLCTSVITTYHSTQLKHSLSAL